MEIPAKVQLRDSQEGSFLLEALIAIVIFSMGVLAIVGMQTAAIKNSSESKYRSDANLLANELIGQMWVGDRTPGATTSYMKTAFEGTAGSGGAKYMSWLANVQSALPGATGALSPTVSVIPASGLVTIDIFWKSPGEAAGATPHKHSVVTQIK